MNRDWIKLIDCDELELYPIQFANCERLVKNDAIYLFDEVGSGKTISSGLMAMDYLYNHSEEKILIITTNTLAKQNSQLDYGQFLQDWFDKLPFLELDLISKIKVVNNHYSHFNKKEKYGLVIIDEAHLFLNKKSMRHELLIKNVRANKVVFLTATPIKNDENDLDVYHEIAENITNKKISDEWIKEMNTKNKSKNELICGSFNLSSPITRYFKDTIMALKIEGFKKIKAKRLLSEIWEYDDDNKLNVLLNNINQELKKNKESKFIIFTRFVEKEAKKIEDFLYENKFKKFDPNINESLETVKVITGDNAYELDQYKGKNNLPTVLILTYQIAEQGVNLPGFNYIINYHISSFPSALEQRFGRIDRMGKNGSQFDEIHMCFLIKKSYYGDIDTFNFYCAMSIYINNLISHVPSKNAILSKEIIKSYYQAEELNLQYIQTIENLLSQPEQISYISKYYSQVPEKKGTEPECDKTLFNFIEENKIKYDICSKNAEENFKKNVKEKLSKLKKSFSQSKNYTASYCEKMIDEIGDKIFYFVNENEEKINTLDAIEDCAQYIKQNNNFKNYEKEAQKELEAGLELSHILKKYLCFIEYLNKYFEDKFVENKLENIFPPEQKKYGTIISNILKNENVENVIEEDKDIIIQNGEYIVKKLPFFKMYMLFKMILRNKVSTKSGKICYKFDCNPFLSAFKDLGNRIRSRDSLGLSQDFIERYWKNKDDLINYNNLFIITQDRESSIITASNWYKLVYQSLNGEFIERDGTTKMKSMFNYCIYTGSGCVRTCMPFPKRYQNPKVSSTDIWTKKIYSELFNVEL